MSSSSEEDDKVVKSSDSDSSCERRHRKKKKSKDKSKKHKKHSKSKKHKKHKRRRSSSSESSGSEEEWVSKEDLLKSKNVDSKESPSTSTMLQPQPELVRPAAVERDEWMTFEGLIPTYSNDSKKARQKKEKEEARQKASIEQLGQSAMELNPYWKNGGTGLPSEDPDRNQPETKQSSSSSSATAAAAVGDGGISWLRKSFQRAKEQAQEEGRSLEEIAADRWGSLEAFYHLLEQAEEKAKRAAGSGSGTRRRSRDEEDSRSRHRDYRHSKSSSHRTERFQRPRDHGDSDDDDDDDNRDSRDRHREENRSSRHSSNYYKSDSRDRHNYDKRYRAEDKSSRISTGGWRKPEPTKTSEPTSSSPSSEAPLNKMPKLNSETKNDDADDNLSNKKEQLQDDKICSEKEEEEEEVKLLSENEMNQLCAKILKAEIMGNQTLLEKLKAQKAEAEKAKKEHEARGGGSIIPDKKKVVVKVILEHQQRQGAGPKRKVKEKPGETHSKEGQRVRYFPDDDKQSLQNMFESEKRNTVENENALFSRLAGKSLKSANEDYDMDDIFTDRASSSKQSMKEKEREVRDIINEDKMYKKTIENCPWCFDGNKLSKNLVVSIGEKSILCLPPYQSLTEGHCLILPYAHASCSTELDEDVWDEIQKFRIALVKMFEDSDQDVVIFESALFLKKSPHMYLECVPMPKEVGELAPIYFKKAIQECETEWAQNKKLIELKNRDVRRAVPKGLPYFSVDFGYDSGFAHVVEDERNFPRNFAQEIVGGMMELDHSLWRKQKQDDFKTQRSKVMNFLKMWGPYDWTR